MITLSCQRHLFDIPDNIAYFNCSYNAPLLVKSAKALVDGALSKRHPWTRKPSDFFDDAEEYRQLASKALGGSSDCYAVIPSASYGCSTVARILEDHFTASDEVVVLSEEFPSNYLPWLKLTQIAGARIVTALTPEDYNWTQSILDQISPKTKLVAIPNCHWTNGALLDLNLIAEATRSVGAFLVLEVTQSLGANPIDIETLKPDFLIAAGYKWLLCPYGLSLFYADPKWHEARPLEETWLSRDGAEVFENLVDYTPKYQNGARRFEMGQKNIPSVLPGGVEALRQIGEWGVENIAQTINTINNKIIGLLENHGFQAVPEHVRSPNILGVRLSNGIPDTLLPALAKNNVFISRRGNSLRFAPHLHINENDIDRLAETLKSIFNK